MEELTFVNSIEYRRSKEIPPPICDSYTFASGTFDGYISFFFSEYNQKWIIKSFHRSDDSNETTMSLACKRGGFFPKQKERN